MAHAVLQLALGTRGKLDPAKPWGQEAAKVPRAQRQASAQAPLGPGKTAFLSLERLRKISQRGRHLSGDLKVKNEGTFLPGRQLGAGRAVGTEDNSSTGMYVSVLGSQRERDLEETATGDLREAQSAHVRGESWTGRQESREQVQ